MLVRSVARASVWWGDLRSRFEDDAGATAVEYAIMLALIAAVIVVAVAFLGRSTSSGLETVKPGFP